MHIYLIFKHTLDTFCKALERFSIINYYWSTYLNIYGCMGKQLSFI